MNAAARLVHQRVFSSQLVFHQFMTLKQGLLMALTMLMLFSAMSIIYVTNTTRGMYATYQHNIIEQNRLRVQQGQLLLERSSWMIQGRIQSVAESKLDMVIPDHNSVVIVSE